jgi:hypothetical protein
MKIKNGYSYKKNGWLYISIKGKPFERGFAYGYLCADKFKEIQQMLSFYVFESYGQPWDYFIEKINEDFKEMTKKDFFELYEEMEGIAEGCNANGCKTSIDEIIAWNFYMSMPYWYSFISNTRVGKEGGGIRGGKGVPDRCSAFIAVGDWTTDGKIVVAHNSFSDFIDGQYANIVLDLNPEKGYRFIMQTSPCWIWSGTDFYVTSSGMIGTETTMGGFMPYKKNIPICYRIRTVMQYASNIDESIYLLINGNSGDYANSWLFGDTKTNEIARIELGLKYFSISKTSNGYLGGFNSAHDPRIRNLELHNSGYYDLRRHQGARRVRLTQLMNKHKGKINIDIAKQIIADHYDVYLKKENNPCSRTVCSHYDLDKREYMSQSDRPVPFAPHGALDGIVCDTNMAKNMSFLGRFGNSCGLDFNKEKYCKSNIQFAAICNFIKDRPSQPWTIFKSINFNREKNKIVKYIELNHFKKLLKKNSSKTDYSKIYSNNKYFQDPNNKYVSTEYYTDESFTFVHHKHFINGIIKSNSKSNMVEIKNKKKSTSNNVKILNNKKSKTNLIKNSKSKTKKIKK